MPARTTAQDRPLGGRQLRYTRNTAAAFSHGSKKVPQATATNLPDQLNVTNRASTGNASSLSSSLAQLTQCGFIRAHCQLLFDPSASCPKRNFCCHVRTNCRASFLQTSSWPAWHLQHFTCRSTTRPAAA